MKNNLLLNLLLATAVSGALTTMVFSGCNEVMDDNNSPSGKSYNREINDGPGAQPKTDPVNSGGIMHDENDGQKTIKNNSTSGGGDGSVGSDLPADTTRGTNNKAATTTPPDKTSTTKTTKGSTTH
jgi:hypothetical protein